MRRNAQQILFHTNTQNTVVHCKGRKYMKDVFNSTSYAMSKRQKTLIFKIFTIQHTNIWTINIEILTIFLLDAQFKLIFLALTNIAFMSLKIFSQWVSESNWVIGMFTWVLLRMRRSGMEGELLENSEGGFLLLLTTDRTDWLNIT